MRKRLLAVILSLTLLMTSVPMIGVTAFAEANEGQVTEATITDPVVVASATELQNAIDNGKAYIRISNSFSMDRTVYVTASTTVYATSPVMLTRASGFTGDMFVVGETKDGKDVLAETGKAVKLNLGLASGGAALTIDGNNVAANGTALYVDHSATVNLYGDVTVQNCNKTGNARIVGQKELSKGPQVGGAAAIIASGALNIRGAKLLNNTVANTEGAVSSLGGAIYNYGTLKMYSGTISGGNAYLGGAVYNYRTVKLFNGTFSNNSANHGGAIAQANSQYAQTVIGNSDACKDGVLFSGNTAVSCGGVFYSSHSDGISVNGLTVYADAKATFDGNSAVNHGGAIYTYGAVNLQGAAFQNNASKDGGAIQLNNGGNKPILSECTFTGNTASSEGGAVYEEAGCNVTIDNCTFTGNTATTSAGAIYVEDSSAGKTYIALKDSVFTQNKALTNHGGAAYIYTNAVANIEGCTFAENTAVTNGGAIYINGAECTACDVDFTNNTADYRGGGVYVAAKDLSGVIINGIYTVNGGVYTGNTSGDNAGAIAYTSDTKCKIYNAEFKSNISGNQGGAVWVYTGNSDALIQNCTFENNKATGTGGGAICSSNSGTVMSLYNNTAIGNEATKAGGFLYTTTTGVTTNLKGLEAKDNKAGTYGSLIYANTTAVVVNIDKASVKDLNTNAQPDWGTVAIVKGPAALSINGYTGDIPAIPTADTPTETVIPTDSVDAVFAMATQAAATDSSYNPGSTLNNSSNFQSRATNTYEVAGVGTVTADTFVYQPGNAANNPNVGEGLLIFQAMQYKKNHPEKDVSIAISSYRFSPETAVNINRNSAYFGYLRSLPTTEFDAYGFVRISYLLVQAAKMGINVTVIGQREASGDQTMFQTYFANHRNDSCDSNYAAGKSVKDFLTCVKSDWDYTNKSATDLMHTKACAVSAYTDANGVDHGGSVWLSSSNLDNVKTNGTNGYDALQTGIIISDHEKLYQVTVNYLNLIKQYSSQNGVYQFRNAVNRMAAEQIDTINAGGTVPADQQIVYKDDVFELYFSAVGGDSAKWDEAYNCVNQQIKALYDSDDYIWFGMNNPKFNDFSLGNTLQGMLAKAFTKNKNVENRIDVNISTADEDSSGDSNFDPAPYSGLTEGTDIGFKSVETNDYNPIHSKDMLLSYSKNGVRTFVTLISSMNMHEGSASYQSNFALVVKESSCGTPSVFRTVAENSMKGFIGKDIAKAGISLSQSAYTYTGAAIQPTVNASGLTAADYTVAYTDNVNVGTGKVVVIGKGNYCGTFEKTFTISPISLDQIGEIIVPAQLYTGEALTPVPEILFNGTQLVNGKDFTVTYANNVNAGTATATITGKGNFAGTVEKTFVITTDSLDSATIAPIADVTYTGSAMEPAIVVTLPNGDVLPADEYTVVYNDGAAHTDCGTVTVRVEGKNNYAGTLTTSFNILPFDVNNASATAIAAVDYTGSATTPAFTLTHGDVTMVNGADYTVAYTNNTKAGTATVTVTGQGNYTGTKTISYTINKIDISKGTVSVGNVVYTGATQTPAVSVTAGGLELTANDYTVAYANNVNAGTATVTVTGKGNFTGTKAVKFTVAKANVEDAVISTIADQAYTGSAIKPVPTVTLNGKTLTRGTDYELSYMYNIEPGSEAVVIIEGMGNYTGETAQLFTITGPQDIAKATVGSISAKTYTGSAIKPVPTVTYNGVKLVKGTDYTVSYSNNTKAGTAKVIIKGIGSYTGQITKTFTIKKAAISTVKITTPLTYNGKVRKAQVTINGKTVSTTDYSVAYYSNSKATKKISASKVKNVGTYYVKITSKNVNFAKGSTIKKMVINPKTITFKSLVAGSKAFTANWTKRTEQTTGFQIRYAKTSAMKSPVTKKVTSTKTTKLKVTGLKARTNYYVQIRTYKTVSGTTYYSAWSTAKAVKTK